MTTGLRIEGIYDLRTFTYLKDQGVVNFSFDCRPRSFNFLQQHRLFELIEKVNRSNFKYFLHYEEERDFVIEKMLSDLNGQGWGPQQFVLEFSDHKELSFYEKFKWPFWIHYFDHSHYPGNNLNNFLNSPYLKGVVFEERQFEELYRSGAWYSVLQVLSPALYADKLNSNTRSVETMLTVSWEFFNKFLSKSSLPSSLNVDFISLPIDNNVEVCYRNVDLFKLEEEIKSIPKDMLYTPLTS